MKEIKFILSKCETSVEAIATLICFVVLYLILPVVFWTNFGWLCGLLVMTNELMFFPAIIRLLDNHGQFDGDEWKK